MVSKRRNLVNSIAPPKEITYPYYKVTKANE